MKVAISCLASEITEIENKLRPKQIVSRVISEGGSRVIMFELDDFEDLGFATEKQSEVINFLLSDED